MSHTYIPLTAAQKLVTSGQIFPSGEANFYDERQEPDRNNQRNLIRDGNGNAIYQNYPTGLGINYSYLSPFDAPLVFFPGETYYDQIYLPSGTIYMEGPAKYNPPFTELPFGVFRWPQLINPGFGFFITNSSFHKPDPIDETIQGGVPGRSIKNTDPSDLFNPYIHYYLSKRGREVEIPYVGDLTEVEPKDQQDPYPSTFQVNN